MMRLLLLVALADASAPSYPNFTLSTFSVDGRDVDAYVPDCVHAKSPIILSLHAWATSKGVMEGVDHLPAYAGAECAVIVYPQGKVRGKMFGFVGFSWNAGGCCPNANTEKTPDYEFLGDVMTATAQKFKVNEDLVFVVGLSNGGMMANRLACANEKVKAFVAVSGPLMNGTGSATEFFPCSRSVPTLHFHGTDDAVVPYNGCTENTTGLAGVECRGLAKLSGFPSLPWPSVPSTIAGWRARNSIPADAQGSITFKNGTTSCTSWGSKANNVSFCTVGGEGHAWPGGVGSRSVACVIPGMHCSHDVDASREAMAFFRMYIPAQAEMLVAPSEPCCQGACKVSGEEKYYSVAKSMFGTKHCGECCMNPKDYNLYHLFEKNLTKADNDSPCSTTFGYTKYDSTATHGFGPVKMTLDLYDLPKATFDIVV